VNAKLIVALGEAFGDPKKRNGTHLPLTPPNGHFSRCKRPLVDIRCVPPPHPTAP
jgi:hypothetical protein